MGAPCVEVLALLYEQAEAAADRFTKKNGLAHCYDVQVLNHLSEIRLAVLRHHFDDLQAGRPRHWQ